MKYFILIIAIVLCSCNTGNNNTADSSDKKDTEKNEKERWRVVPNGSNWGVLYLDAQSLVFYDNEKTECEIWSKEILNENGATTIISYYNDKKLLDVNYTLALLRFDLQHRKLMVIELSYYDSKDHLLHKVNSSREWQSIVPNSSGEKQLDAIKEIIKEDQEK